MPECQIASKPLNGWNRHFNHSKVSLEWLAWCHHQLQQEAWNALMFEQQEQCDDMAQAYNDAEQQLPLHRLHIKHARNTGEYHIPDTSCYADGFDADTLTVYELFGCLWQGCPTCFPNRQEPGQSMHA